MTVYELIALLIKTCEKRHLSVETTPVYLMTSELDEQEIAKIVFCEQTEVPEFDPEIEKLPERILLSE